ncbi:5-bromo-4-chloroindolyl phosphate hydrolysis family protein [Lacrimispora sp.]|uniref:5-bromo-4-chloroindolyl phosphate hydrolysis family protein n=2 Tax=Lacrimispora sp. TaxID=2719234 RepID=UPI00289B6B3A|nr:5-bromo-4-chloroindolyl phosphate hydrolysis family protein [Lacrimispora sp.]
MDNKEFSNLGDQIRDSVQNAIDSMDFNQLNRTISDTVNSALEEARSQLIKGAEFGKNIPPGSFSSQRSERTETYRKTEWSGTTIQREGREDGPGYRAFQTSRDVLKRTGDGQGELAQLNQTGRVSGILYTVFGSIGIGIILILLLVVWIVALVVKPVIWAVAGATLILLLLGGVSGFMLRAGIGIRDRLKRARIYAKQSGKRMYCSIEELAGNIGRSRDFVLKDVQKMIKLGIFKQAYLDEQKTCLILSENTYRQYLECQKALKERELEEVREKAKEVTPSEEIKQMMADGQNYLRILREANDAIPGEVISQKISNLEHVIRRIFESVSKHPGRIGEMERFMEYYLPTTVKLVNAYRDFDSVGTQGANISSAKAEIERTLDTINQAFERLLDDLYQDAALDVSTDASVIQTMLKKDGWAESDFTGGMKNE